ncbi:unnamed protein product [Phyllotreta striolata]|uniref:Protein quiver n=1 Tax=Phyllotreta striolata TaxID=444603 RepID=A0A9N9XTG1_PHYSR|nr:unnamed protein product [Phyllotreta striolata]
MIKLAIFAFLFGQCVSLRCFTCSSQVDLHNGMKSECDYFSYWDKTKISECVFPNVCAKYFVDHDGVRWVHRSCRPYDICPAMAIKYNNNRNSLVECATCSDSDLCNSSENIEYSLSSITTGVVLIYSLM